MMINCGYETDEGMSNNDVFYLNKTLSAQSKNKIKNLCVLWFAVIPVVKI